MKDRETMMSCASLTSRLRIAAVVAAASFWATSPVSAQESTSLPGDRDQQFDFSLSAGASHSDNIAREPDDEESGTIGLAGVQLVYGKRSKRLEADIDVNATYENYSDDTFDDGVIGGADARLQFGIVPDRFTWLVQENFGQVTSDPFAADTPENREDINYFTTGPDLVMHFASEMSLRIAARFSDVQYEVADTDGTQYAGSVALARALSSASSLSLILEASSYEFDDNTFNTDYDRNQAYLRYEIKGRRTELTADLGYSVLDIEDESPDGVLARFSLTRQMSSATNLTASLGTQFSESGEMFRDGQDILGVSTETSMVTGISDPFRSDFASLSFDFDRNRTAFGFSVRAENERYETQTEFDRDLLEWGVFFLRRLSPVLDVSLFGRLESQDFRNVDFSNDDLDIGLQANWTLGRRFSLRFQLDRIDRDSSNPATDYVENRASLRAVWSPRGSTGQGPFR